VSARIAPRPINLTAFVKRTSMNPFASCFRRSAGTTLAVVSIALLFCAPAQASRNARRTTARHRPVAVSPPRAATAAVVPTATPPPVTPGMVVSIEPETGRLVMPSAAELQRLSAAERTGLLRTSAGLTEVRLPNGAVMVDLQGRFMEFTVVRRDLQGRLHFLGVDEAPALLRQLDPRAPAPTPACEER
jgi:hypothetical protein